MKVYKNKNNNTINSSNGGTCIPYSMHHAPPFQKTGFSSSSYNKNNITPNYSQRHFLQPRKQHQLSTTVPATLKLPSSIPSSPRHHKNIEQKNINTNPDSDTESYTMSPKRMRKMLNIKTEINYNDFINTIDRNNYLRFDFSFLEDKDFYRIAPDPIYECIELSEKFNNLSMGPAEKILLDLKGNSDSAPKFQNEAERYSYLAHLIVDSIKGIREEHNFLFCDDKLHNIDDVFYAQRELDVLFTSMNESVKSIVTKSKPLALILHNIQKGLLSNSRKLIETIAYLFKELSNKKEKSEVDQFKNSKEENNNKNDTKEENNKNDQKNNNNKAVQFKLINSDSNDANINDIDNDNFASANSNETDAAIDTAYSSQSNEKLASRINELKKELKVEKGRNEDFKILLLSLKMQIAEARSKNQQLAEINEDLNNVISELQDKLNRKDEERKPSKKSKPLKTNLKMKFDDYFNSINNRLEKTASNDYGSFFDINEESESQNCTEIHNDIDSENSEIIKLNDHSEGEKRKEKENVNTIENEDNDNKSENANNIPKNEGTTENINNEASDDNKENANSTENDVNNTMNNNAENDNIENEEKANNNTENDNAENVNNEEKTNDNTETDNNEEKSNDNAENNNEGKANEEKENNNAENDNNDEKENDNNDENVNDNTENNNDNVENDNNINENDTENNK